MNIIMLLITLISILIIILISKNFESFSPGSPYIFKYKNTDKYDGGVQYGHKSHTGKKLCDCCSCGMMNCDKCMSKPECCENDNYDVMTYYV